MPLAAGAAGKVSRTARSQETTFVRATFAEPRREVLVAVRRFSRVLVAGIPLRGVSVLLFRMRRLFSILVALVAIACDNAGERGNALLDDFGDSVSRAAAPRRIVS